LIASSRFSKSRCTNEETEAEHFDFIKRLSGKFFEVLSSLIVKWKTDSGEFAMVTHTEMTKVNFSEISDDIIWAYVAAHPDERQL